MSTTLPWRVVYEQLLDSGDFTTPDGKVIQPTFGNYLDTIAGETDVFMTIGVDPFNIRAFNYRDNKIITIDDSGYTILTDTNHQTISLLVVPKPIPTVTSSEFPTNGDQFEP